MTVLDKTLKSIRPRIESVAPVQGYGVLVFGTFNVLFGLSLFFLKGQFNTDVAIVNPLFTYQVWGIGFILSGSLLLKGFMTNDWALMRQMLLIMIFSKMIWELALFFRLAIHPHSSAIIFLIWSLITALQLLLYLFFPSSGKRDSNV